MAENENNSEEQKPKIYHVIHAISLIIIGFGVGWLAGLSVSPVATILISGLLGVAITIVGFVSISLVYRDDKGKIIRGVGFKAAEKISIGWLALLVFGIVLGVMVGIFMRTHNCLGVDSFVKLRNDLEQLQVLYDGKKDGEKEIGLEKEEIARRILDKYYPEGGLVEEHPVTDLREAQGSPVLFNNDAATHCERLLIRPMNEWRKYINRDIPPDNKEQFTKLERILSVLGQEFNNICPSYDASYCRKLSHRPLLEWRDYIKKTIDANKHNNQFIKILYNLYELEQEFKITCPSSE